MTITEQPSLREMAIATYLESERQQERDRQKPSELKYARRVSTLLGLLEQKLGVDTWLLAESLYPIASWKGMVPAYKSGDDLITIDYVGGDWTLALQTYCDSCKQRTLWPFSSAAGLGELLTDGRLCHSACGEALASFYGCEIVGDGMPTCEIVGDGMPTCEIVKEGLDG